MCIFLTRYFLLLDVLLVIKGCSSCEESGGNCQPIRSYGVDGIEWEFPCYRYGNPHKSSQKGVILGNAYSLGKVVQFHICFVRSKGSL